jgi:glutamyl-tRNA synthetase
MNKSIRVRFAPSPTGPLHIGGVRTALYNYLFAKKHGGTFVLRIEDTDQNRYVPNAEQYIVDALEWCGIPFDEGPGKNEKFGPYRQSERKELYREYAEKLVASGKAYYAFDSSEELEAEREKWNDKKEPFIYNHSTREQLNNSLCMGVEMLAKKLASGDSYVIRFKMYETKEEGNTVLESNDLIRGNVQFKRPLLDDKILFKSDGMPTYHLANIVDDHLMEISHVIRGEEWLPSLPLHIALYDAFGWAAPEFAHLPLILKPVGKGKLSKRDGDKLGFPVFPLAYKNEETGELSKGYKEEGYLSAAFVNMLALLGWNPGTEQELFEKESLVQNFSLEKVSKSGAKFSPEKTNWFNQQYVQQMSVQELSLLFLPLLNEKGVNFAIEQVEFVVEMVKERAVFVKDLWELSNYFFESPKEYDPKAVKKQWKPDTEELMEGLKTTLKELEDFSSKAVENDVKKWMVKEEIGFGKIMAPFRLSVVGALKGPHLFDIVAFIGKEETVRRIEKAIAFLK